jgi:hypothetical protein
MSKRHLRLALLGAVAMLGTSCATQEEWETWKSHPSHFASGEHLGFSVRNRAGQPPRVTRTDIAMARDEGWWGKPVTVSTDQIVER